MTAARVLFCGRANDPISDRLTSFLAAQFGTVETMLSASPREPIPQHVAGWQGDYIFSFRSLCILPVALLDRARKLALNFHPGPPEYPGIGCINFALYQGATEFGVTCHHMLARPDSGPIVAVERFAVLPEDDVGSLLSRTHHYLEGLFFRVVGEIVAGRQPQVSGDAWAGRATTRNEMEALYRVPVDATADELTRRIRATSFGRYQPWIELHGRRFYLAKDRHSLSQSGAS